LTRADARADTRATVLDSDDRLKLDYDQTTQLLRALMDVRFKLLAFVPIVSGAAVGLLGRPRPAAELVGVGLLGLVATLGVFVYELRNSQLLDALVHRAGELERLLGLSSVLGSHGAGGLFIERPPHSVRFASFLPAVGHGAWRSSMRRRSQGGRISWPGACSAGSRCPRRAARARRSA
jgi:hypothetical protein